MLTNEAEMTEKTDFLSTWNENRTINHDNYECSTGWVNHTNLIVATILQHQNQSKHMKITSLNSINCYITVTAVADDDPLTLNILSFFGDRKI